MTKVQILEWIKEYGKVSFARSGGPGGQYVNTADTKAVLRLPLSSLPVGETEKQRIFTNLKTKITTSNELVIHSSSTRSQMQNRKLAEEKALQIIFSALKVIRRRHQTQASKSSKERRLTTKKALSRKKQFRKKPELE